MTFLLTGTAALAAGIGVFGMFYTRGIFRPGLLLLTYYASWQFVMVTIWPQLWTPERFVHAESVLAILAVFVGLGAAQRARTQPHVLFAALCLMGTAGALGWYSMELIPMVRNYAYRGTAFVDLAVYALLATVAGRSYVTDALDGIALRWLSLAFALSCVRLMMFEVHFGLGRFFGWLQVFAWTVGMLLIARAAIARWQPPSPSR